MHRLIMGKKEIQITNKLHGFIKKIGHILKRLKQSNVWRAYRDLYEWDEKQKITKDGQNERRRDIERDI